MKLSELKLSQIRKLTECYWVKHPFKLGGTKETNNTQYVNSSIYQMDNENIQYGLKHYMLYDEEHIFTTLQEAIDYCKEHKWNYSLIKNYQYKQEMENIIW